MSKPVTPPASAAALADQIARTIAAEIGAKPEQARAAIGLLDEGATVPFIASYRKAGGSVFDPAGREITLPARSGCSW